MRVLVYLMNHSNQDAIEVCLVQYLWLMRVSKTFSSSPVTFAARRKICGVNQ